MGKTCTKCGKYLSLDNFYKNKHSKDGITGTCKACKREYSKAYRDANPEKVKATVKAWHDVNSEKVKTAYKAWYETNSEKVKATSKAWNEANPEKKKATDKAYSAANPEKRKAISQSWNKYNPEKGKATSKAWHEANIERAKAQQREWYENNIEKVNVTTKAWREANPKKVKAACKKWSTSNPEKIRNFTQRRNARKRSLLSTLTPEQWENIKHHFNNCCAYCGNSLPLTQDHLVPLSKGGEYTINNIIPACGSCNSSKGPEMFEEWFPSFKHYSKEREQIILEYLNYDKQNIQQLSIL